jgi:hypothetical protein
MEQMCQCNECDNDLNSNALGVQAVDRLAINKPAVFGNFQIKQCWLVLHPQASSLLLSLLLATCSHNWKDFIKGEIACS